jgi:hypothetical protein
MCWGASAQDHEQTHEAALARLPARVEGLDDARSIEVHGAGACARTAADAWKCWSWGTKPNDWTQRMGPASVAPRLDGDAASTHGVCECTLSTSGAVACVGSGILSARLADGSSPPVQLHDCPPDGLAGVRTLGERCAITTDGALRCWGPLFFARGGAEPKYEELREPIAIDGLGDVVTLAEGASHTCVQTGGGDVLCWGSNAQGQIDGTPSDRSVWPPRAIAARPS